MSSPNPVYSTAEEQTKALADFIARHAVPYDPTTDDYDRPAFAADIKEGKNDPIYNAHSYHTKVPPRIIIPYILHYTQPGDLVLDLFCGSGMTGVAAQMCASPPPDILEQFPDLRDRVGPRACILNDLSPAACHIAYNYNTLVDVDALKREFERIMAAVKEEFDWLYGTEHYEPAVGVYAATNAEVASRLKNPSAGDAITNLLGEEERTWELLTRAEVEARLGYPVADLPRDDEWGDIDLAKVEKWVCIPATIQYTIWSDVYRCEGFVTLEEPTGKISKRGKNAGKPIIQRRSVERGCRKEFSLWDVGIDPATNEVRDNFRCPHCRQEWTTENAALLRTDPSVVIYTFPGLRATRKGGSPSFRRSRRLSQTDLRRVERTIDDAIQHWFPTTALVPGEQGNPFLNRGIRTVDKFWAPRTLRALARLWSEMSAVDDRRVRDALRFLFTSISVGTCSRMTRYNFGKRGNGAMAMRLYFPHFQAEANVGKILCGKLNDVVAYYTAASLQSGSVCVTTKPAQELREVPDASVDFIFADPPFGRNIAYAELNVLWEAWLGVVTDVNKEAITSNGRKWDVDSYAGKMRGAFHQMYRILKPGRYALVEFNNSDPELRLFEQIKNAAITAGFKISNMVILDKKHKSYNQMVGIIRGEDTVDKDVVFNLHKPATCQSVHTTWSPDLEEQVANAIREYLHNLPSRAQAEPGKYTEEYRTSATIHSMLMNTLIPRGVSVERLNLSFIEKVCLRFFRKVGQRWYLRGEAIGNHWGAATLLEEEVTIADEVTAIEWLRQKVKVKPALIGELKPPWMRATGLLSAELSQSLVLEDLLMENFWRDVGSNRWREPTAEERERMSDDRSIRVLHDAERFVAGTLRRATTDAERCEWIDVLFSACRAIEADEQHAIAALRGFERMAGYRLITRLFQTILREEVAKDSYARAEKQMRVASQRIAHDIEAEAAMSERKRGKSKGPTLFDPVGDV